ncbi:MAG TPA: type ISP restriction/modification enzyme, partial [Jatrophihabitans sp.]
MLTVHDEVTLTELNSRPDMAVDAPSGRVGYIELNAPGKGTPETWRANQHDRLQWEKLKHLPNLIYTDGNSWALYQKGELVGKVGTLDGDLARAGRHLKPADSAFEQLLKAFLYWKPEQPRTMRAIVADVAPLCRLLRDQVSETLTQERAKRKQPFTILAMEWRSILFPTSEKNVEVAEQKFADSYAQAVTFGLLLARVDGVSFEGRSPAGIAEQLGKQHSLLGEALAILAHPKWVGHLNVVDTLVRVIGNINWSNVRVGDADTYAKLYETFLEHYDPELRRHSGTYYTPAPVARAMVSFVDEILKEHLGKRRGFASDDVIVVDPAMGAGTFLAEVLENAANTLRSQRNSKAVPAAHLRELFANRLIGFEIQAAPFAVAELRLHAALRNRYQVEIPAEEPRFLTDTLDDPYAMPFDFGQLYNVLKESRRRANQVKRDVPVMVVIGNPPWRERARGAAKWIEEKRSPSRPVDTSKRPSLDEFRAPGSGKLAFNLNNMWTYFWRWSTWKAFEANDPAGVVALITPSAYLTSKSYAGMRQYLREISDEGWIIDLSPEEHRSDAGTRIFPETQHTICIGIFVRSGSPRPDLSAPVHYVALTGTQKEKFDSLSQLSIKGSDWKECSSSWQAAFRPYDTDWEAHPLLGNLLPWQQTGVNSNRNWVWAPDSETLQRRWEQLIVASPNEKIALFKETRDRKINRSYVDILGATEALPLVHEERTRIETTEVAFRSFDRQRLIFDRRVIDFPRTELWQSQGPRQIYVCEQHAHAVQNGPGLTFSALVPNVHCFDGRGGRVMPLYRDSDATVANLAPKLTRTLSQFIGCSIDAADVISYVAAIVAHVDYTERFREQLKTPGIRVPITLDKDLWQEAVMVGRRVLWLHTYGSRMVNPKEGRPQGLGKTRRAKYIIHVPSGDAQLPTSIKYDDQSETLIIGDDTLFEHAGQVGPVRKETWEYKVGGVQI